LLGAAAGNDALGVTAGLAGGGDLGRAPLGVTTTLAEISEVGTAAGIIVVDINWVTAGGGDLGTAFMGIKDYLAEIFEFSHRHAGAPVVR
jgi:hypothetical protein